MEGTSPAGHFGKLVLEIQETILLKLTASDLASMERCPIQFRSVVVDGHRPVVEEERWSPWQMCGCFDGWRDEGGKGGKRLHYSIVQMIKVLGQDGRHRIEEIYSSEDEAILDDWYASVQIEIDRGG